MQNNHCVSSQGKALSEAACVALLTGHRQSSMAPKLQPYWVFVKAMRTNGSAMSEEECSHRWKDMNADERKPYVEAARQNNPHPSRGSSSSDGLPATRISSRTSQSTDRGVLSQTEALKKVQQYLTSSLEDAKTKKVIVAASCLLMEFSDVDPCIPMEIAFATYSLEEGITSMFHRFTDPGPIPAGCLYQSRIHCQKTHGIPVSHFPPAIGQEDRIETFRNMLDQILRYMKDCYRKTSHVLLFTRGEMIDQVRAALVYYAREGQHRLFQRMMEQGRIVVTDTAYLIGSFYLLAGEPKSLTECQKIATSVMFDFKNRCPFHTQIDNNFCALSLCSRWCFLISDHLLALPQMDIVPVPGCHLPLADASGIHIEEGKNISCWGDVSECSDGAAAVQPDVRDSPVPDEANSPEPARSRSRGSGAIPTGFSLNRGRGRGRN